jgi:hypothetical protein
MNISFDFDETLNKYDSLQSLAEKLINLGNEVCIITARTSNQDNTDLFELASKLSISKNKVIFAEKPEWKWNYILLKNIHIHFENNLKTVKMINDLIPTKPAVCVGLDTSLSDADK